MCERPGKYWVVKNNNKLENKTDYYRKRGNRYDLDNPDGPASVLYLGIKEWFVCDYVNRDEAPAVIFPDGTKEWWKDDYKQRIQDRI